MKKQEQKREILVKVGNVGRKITPYETKNGDPAIRFSLGVDTASGTEWYTCFLHGDAALKAIGGEDLEGDRIEKGTRVQIRGFFEEVKRMGKETERHLNVYNESGIAFVTKATWSAAAKKRFAAMKRAAAKA